MRILVIHNSYKIRSGEYNVFQNEVRMLKEFGHQVEEVVFDNVILSTPFAKLRAGILSVYNPISSKLIKNKIAEFKPDVIHVHNFFPLISPSVFFKKTTGNVPVVMTLHNFRLICPNALLFRDGEPCEICVNKRFPLSGVRFKCYRNSYFQTFSIVLMVSVHKLLGTWRRRIGRYIVLSGFQKNKFIRSSLGLKEDQMTVKPNFVFDENHERVLKKNDYFIYIGRLENYKGVGTLINAFIGQERRLKIIGEGSMRGEIENVCKKNKNIEYLGEREHEFVMKELNLARALIFPSHYYEGFPVVIAEAFSCATPVISSDTGSHSEIVINGFNGLHFKVGDPGDLISKVMELSEMKENLINKNALDTSKNFYSKRKNYQTLMSVYEELIEKEKTL